MTVHPFAVSVKTLKWLLFGAALFLIYACGDPFSVTVDQWKVGSADVAGSITNHSGAGCSDPEITLQLRDHNDAIVRSFTFGAGDLGAGISRHWSTHMVGLLVDAPVEANVTQITAAAECADQH